MKIYDSEKGIKDAIVLGSKLSFASQAVAANDSDIKNIMDGCGDIEVETSQGELKSLASINDKDLYYHKSVLVTTNWNSNDDVFLPEVVWAAKNSPVHKPTNLNHDSDHIVGHITSSWAVDVLGNKIPEKTSDSQLPNKFHILVGSVIYKDYNSESHRDNESRQSDIDDLIEGIESGEQFVSMEAVLKDFDYAVKPIAANGVTDASNKGQVIQRNSKTAFLSKHLRAFGGTGEFEGHKIGRVLRKISFIGKGYTPKPANAESVIFTKDKTESDVFSTTNIGDFVASSSILNIWSNNPVTDFNYDYEGVGLHLSGENSDSDDENSVVSISKTDFNGDHSMAEVLQEQVNELKAERSELLKTVDELKVQVTTAGVKKLTDEVASLNESVESLRASLSDKDGELKDISEKLEASTSEKTELEDSNKELKSELDKVEAASIVAQRVATLVDGSISKDEAEAKVEVFAGLSDDQFKVVADELIKAAKLVRASEGTPEGDEAPTQDEKDEEVAESTNLDESKEEKTETAEASIDQKDDEVLSIVASLSEKLKLELDRKGDK